MKQNRFSPVYRAYVTCTRNEVEWYSAVSSAPRGACDGAAYSRTKGPRDAPPRLTRVTPPTDLLAGLAGFKITLPNPPSPKPAKNKPKTTWLAGMAGLAG